MMSNFDTKIQQKMQRHATWDIYIYLSIFIMMYNMCVFVPVLERTNMHTHVDVMNTLARVGG